jgi:hypothetical protein
MICHAPRKPGIQYIARLQERPEAVVTGSSAFADDDINEDRAFEGLSHG